MNSGGKSTKKTYSSKSTITIQKVVSTELWILPRHNKHCTLQFIYLKNIVHSVIHIILFVIKNINHPAGLMLTVNSFKPSKQHSVEEKMSYSQYNHPHLIYKVRKNDLKACVRPLRQHAGVAHTMLMFRTVKIQTPLEIHSSISHTMIWVQIRAFSPKRCQFYRFAITDKITKLG